MKKSRELVDKIEMAVVSGFMLYFMIHMFLFIVGIDL